MDKKRRKKKGGAGRMIGFNKYGERMDDEKPEEKREWNDRDRTYLL
jgi:hypothetical protein